MKKLIPLVAALIMFTADAADSSVSPVFQMRWIAETPSADSEEMSLVHKVESGPRVEVLNVKKAILFDQTALKSARVATNDGGQPQIEIVFTEEGAKRFADMTRQNIGKRLAIIVSGRLCCAPVIRAEVSGGKAHVTGSFTKKEAQELATKISEAIAK
jgi:preprotein translocase subunit SecD